MNNNSFRLKEDNISQRNRQNQLSHPSLSQFDCRQDSHPIKFERRPQILLEPSFGELLIQSYLSDFFAFNKMSISSCQKRGKNQKSRL